MALDSPYAFLFPRAIAPAAERPRRPPGRHWRLSDLFPLGLCLV